MSRDKNSFIASECPGAEGKLFIAHIDDMLRLSEKTCAARFSAFLSEAEAVLAEKYLRWCGNTNYLLYGGYGGAQRVVLGVFPGFSEPDPKEFPIAAVRFFGRAVGGLSHRDYLGSLMALGITRSSVGDIICSEEEAFALLLPAAADMALGIEKIGRAGVKTELADTSGLERNDSFAEISGTVASLRLDSVLGTALRLSREKACRLIRSGSVSVNHAVTESVSEILSEGDVLSVRGFGRFILDTVGGRTSKDRLHITVKKYL